MEKVMHEKYGKSLYFPPNYAMNRNLLSEIKFNKCFKKWFNKNCLKTETAACSHLYFEMEKVHSC